MKAYDHAQEKGKKYIGISEDRLHHIIGVARKAYAIAKQRGHSEEFARKMFMDGWLHDVGYEFSEKQGHHPHESGELVRLIMEEPSEKPSRVEKAIRERQSPRPFLMEWTRLAERRRYNSFSMRKNISFLLQA